jgi:hypothetical protein
MRGEELWACNQRTKGNLCLLFFFGSGREPFRWLSSPLELLVISMCISDKGILGFVYNCDEKWLVVTKNLGGELLLGSLWMIYIFSNCVDKLLVCANAIG